jgi:hypothetical protein
MSKNGWLVLSILFIFTTVTLGSFARYYASNFSMSDLSSNCDKYLQLVKTTSGITQHNALSDYNICSDNAMTASVGTGISRSKMFLYLDVTSFMLLIFSLVNFIRKSKV